MSALIALSDSVLSAEGGVGGAADVVAAGDRDHVVQPRDVFLQDRDHGAEGRVGVDDGVDVVARIHDVQVKAPFGRGHEIALIAAVFMHEDDVLRLHRLVRPPRWRDQHPTLDPCRDIPGCPLIDAGFIHLQAGVDDRLPDVF